MEIAICDDIISEGKALAVLIEKLSKTHSKDWRVDIFDSGKKLLQNINDYDVVLLDMEMPKLDGFETGQLIKKYKPACIIIMETSKYEHANKACSIGASRYLVKPIDKISLLESLLYAERNTSGVQSKHEYLDVNIGRRHFDIPIDKIIKIEADKGICNIYTENNVYNKQTTLKEMSHTLIDKNFVRTNRYRIINLSYVSDYKNNEIHLPSEVIELSRNHRKEFEKAWLDYKLG